MKVSKTSLDAVIATLNARSDAQDETLKRIEVQTTATNGRVRSLEKWRWMVVGGLAVVSAIVGIVATVVAAK